MAVPIVGLSMGGCGAEQVERALRSAPGVLEAYVNRATETAYVQYDAERVGLVALRRRIEALALYGATQDVAPLAPEAKKRHRSGPMCTGSSRLLHSERIYYS